MPVAAVISNLETH